MDMELAAPPVERGPVDAAVVLTVNREEHEVRLEPRVSLLDAAQPARRGTSLVIELPLEPAGELNGCGCAHLHLCRWLGISTSEVLD